MAIMTAARVQELVGVADNVVVAHGYTFARDTLDVFFEGGKLVRVETPYKKPERYKVSSLFEPVYFTADVKRWYYGFNEPLKDLFSTFGTVFDFVHGGTYPDRMFLPEGWHEG